MKLKYWLALTVIGMTGALPMLSQAAPILQPGDPILAIDFDFNTSQSAYPDNESPGFAFDDDLGTKYLNFGEETSGVIVTPAFGSSIVKSLVLGTANDAVDRDPASYKIWGTNDAILALDNDEGDTGEAWSLISEGAVTLPEARGVLGPVLEFASNAAAYTSYRITFPTVKNAANANSMQVSEIRLFTSADGTGDSILDFSDDVKAYRTALPFDVPQSNYPAGEAPAFAIDGLAGTKYLNFGEENSGFIVTPQAGPTTVTSLRIRTANDAEARDPVDYELFGTNDDIVSADNSIGDGETWTSIQVGTLNLPPDRLAASDVVPVTNATSYKSYRLVFNTVKDAANTNSMQIADVQFFDDTAATSSGDFDYDGDVDGADFLAWQRGLGQTDQFYRSTGDANLDGNVTDADLAIWKAQFGSGAAMAAGAVPEPSSAILAALGIVAYARLSSVRSSCP